MHKSKQNLIISLISIVLSLSIFTVPIAVSANIELDELEEVEELDELGELGELDEHDELDELDEIVDDNYYDEAQDDSEIKSYQDVLYDNTNGMPTSEANDIVQTDDGYIWIASYSSLLRYDGREFVSITEPKGLTSVMCLLKDSQGRLWIGTNNDGVVLYENREFKFIDTNGLEKSSSVRTITENSEGNIIVGTTMGIYQIDNDLNIEFATDPLIADAFVSEMKGFDGNKVVGVTRAGAFFILEGLDVVEYIDAKDWAFDIPLSVLPLNETTFLVGVQSNYIVYMEYTPTGVEYVRINTWTLEHINAIVLMEEYGDIWFASDTGAGFIDADWNVYILGALKMNNSIENIFQDHEGNYWLTSSKQGVLKITINIFQELTLGLENVSQINAVEIMDDYIYIVSDLGIQILDINTGESIENELTMGFANMYIRCVDKDDYGNLWFSTYSDDGLVRYTPQTGEIMLYNFWNGLDYTRIRSSMTARDGLTWVATGNGVYVVDDYEVIAHFDMDDGINNLEILSISEDLQGRIFVGTDGAGFYIIEDMQVVSNITKKDGLTSEIVLRTEADLENGGTWIVTANSITFYSAEGEITNIDKFPYSNNFDLLFNGDEIIVLSSNGVYFTSRESMLSDDETLEYIHKNHLDGLNSTIVSNSFSKIVDDVLYICTNGAVVALPLDFSGSSFTVPDIHFMSISYNDKVIYPEEDGKFHIGNDANQFDLDVLIPTFALQNFDVSFYLEGYDKAPRVYSFENFSHPSYTNLPGGTYNFVLEILDTRTGEMNARNEITIIKNYTLYEHPSFKFFMTVMLVGTIMLIAYIIITIREQKSKAEQERMLTLFEEVVLAFSKVIDAKDGYTNGHSRRVAIYTREMARALNFSETDITMTYGVALLHDVGKIAVPDLILNKPNRLTEEEFSIMKSHPDRGAEILDDIKSLPDIAIGAKYHHEKYDGTGYGHQLKGEEIPYIARIICIADAFDAMYSSRVYRKQLELEKVLSEIEANKGTQFDPELATVFVDLVRAGKLDKEFEKLSLEEESNRTRELADIERVKEQMRVAEEREQALQDKLKSEQE